MTLSEPVVRGRLSDWKVWMVIAYFGLVIAGVGLYQLYSTQSTETAKRVAAARAAAVAQVTACAVAVRNAPVVDGFMDGQRAIIRNQILSTIGALAASTPADPLYPVRKESLRRLQQALSNTNRLAGLIATTTPAQKDCNALAKKLGVAAPFPRRL